MISKIIFHNKKKWLIWHSENSYESKNTKIKAKWRGGRVV